MVRRFGVLAVMIIVVAALGYAGARNLRARRAAMDANHVQLIPANGPGADAGMPDAQGASLQGKAAPAFTLTSVDGKKVSLSDFKGHPVVVNFWATWCGPCKLEMPWFQEFYGKYKPQGLVILGLSQDDGMRREDVASAAKKIGVSYPVLVPDEGSQIAKAYGGVEYLPETFYVSKTGKVISVTAGAPSKDQMEGLIEQTISAQ